VLRSADVQLLVDVRRYPGSRRLPHLNRDQLEHTIAAAGLEYRWSGEALGGRRSRRSDSRHPAWRNPAFQGYADHTDSAEFRTALDALRREDTRAAVMCSETVWWRCHRRLIADAAKLRGTEVVHLLSTTNHQAHPLHPNVRADDEGWPVYDVGVARPISDADG
jgi:uncharacterized protein (DUF488 family)